MIKFIDKDFDNNNYLKILGNLPIYKNVKEKLNIKIINVVVRKIKEKIKKYYGYKDLLTFENLEDIHINTKFENKSKYQEI